MLFVLSFTTITPLASLFSTSCAVFVPWVAVSVPEHGVRWRERAAGREVVDLQLARSRSRVVGSELAERLRPPGDSDRAGAGSQPESAKSTVSPNATLSGLSGFGTAPTFLAAGRSIPVNSIAYGFFLTRNDVVADPQRGPPAPLVAVTLAFTMIFPAFAALALNVNVREACAANGKPLRLSGMNVTPDAIEDCPSDARLNSTPERPTAPAVTFTVKGTLSPIPALFGADTETSTEALSFGGAVSVGGL